MKANKINVTITVEGLHIDIVYGIVTEALKMINEGTISGNITKDDGDNVSWWTKQTPVEF